MAFFFSSHSFIRSKFWNILYTRRDWEVVAAYVMNGKAKMLKVTSRKLKLVMKFQFEI